MCMVDIGNQCVGGWQQQDLLADSSPNKPLGPLTEWLLGSFKPRACFLYCTLTH